MTPSALDIGAVLVLILPGFLSHRSALARRADPARRSTLWQLAEMLEYSLYVHLLGVALVLGIAALLDCAFRLESHLSELPSMKPHEYLSAYFVEGTLIFTLYPLYVVVASVLMGAYSIPHQVATLIVMGGGRLARWIGAIPFLGWIKPPSPDFPVEPIWYKAFHVATRGFEESRPEVMVKMKRGDIYHGVLGSYPILPDSQRAKDFLIVQARYAPAGHQGRLHSLEAMNGGGTVLLNSADVDSIQVYYAPTEDVQE